MCALYILYTYMHIYIYMYICDDMHAHVYLCIYINSYKRKSCLCIDSLTCDDWEKYLPLSLIASCKSARNNTNLEQVAWEWHLGSLMFKQSAESWLLRTFGS